MSCYLGRELWHRTVICYLGNGNIFSKALSTETVTPPPPSANGRAFPEWVPHGKFPKKAGKLLMLS